MTGMVYNYRSLPDASGMTMMPRVKTHLKILVALVSAGALWFGVRYVADHRDRGYDFETLTLTGWITPEAFVQVRDRLIQSVADKKTFVIKESGGGDGATAMAIGTLIHRHNWDVEVVDICASACADFIFPAGKTKYLNQKSMLLFHGGPYQANALELAEKLDQELARNGAPVDTVTFGREDKEGTISFTPGKTVAKQKVLEFMSMTDVSTAVEMTHALRRASDQLYRELGVNPLLPTYGQIGAYESKYKSYKYGGFIYRLDSLRRLGVGNIELKQGEWHPERHAAYQDVYEVAYP